MVGKRKVDAGSSAGRALWKARERARWAHRNRGDHDSTLLDTGDTELTGSKLEETSLEQFLTEATLANRDFTAVRLSSAAIKNVADRTMMVNMEGADAKSTDNHWFTPDPNGTLPIPRRPTDRPLTNSDELTAAENELFLRWRRNLAHLEEVDGIALTPFERNIEIWRQLWRVVERSDVVVQILDARHPLIFRSVDLEKYVKEVDANKENFLLVNKADLLSSSQINEWKRYFHDIGVNHFAFWSASAANANGSGMANPDIINGAELIRLLKSAAHKACSDPPVAATPIVAGFVGYPNVGKSSTINALIGKKKVAVSATPGKTRHLQTIKVDDELTLCDCPGLVMPSVVFGKEEMLFNGILPIDQMRDHLRPIELLCQRFPRQILESAYSVKLPKPADHEPTDRAPTAHELLTTVAFMRGFMGSGGVPDCSRAARTILKDVVNGRLVYAVAPPDINQSDFDEFESIGANSSDGGSSERRLANVEGQLKGRHLIDSAEEKAGSLDRSFFTLQKTTGRGSAGAEARLSGAGKKHYNHNKKEKLRRVFGYLDA